MANGRLNGETDAADWVREAFEQHRGSLLRYCRTLTGNHESAEEIVQETFTRLCREQAIDEASHVKRWLFKVCRNQAIDETRKQRPITMSTLQEQDVETDDLQPDEQFVASETVARLMQFVAALPARQLEVVRLRFQAELSYAEIAEVIDTSVDNVGVLLHEAIKNLRQKMKETGSHDDQ